MLWLCGILSALAAQVVELDLDGHVYHPVWSADGHALLVERNRHQDQAELLVVTLDEGGQATRIREVALPGSRNPFSGSAPVAMNPVWTGEGFLFEATDARGRFRIYQGDRQGRSAVWEGTASLEGNLTFPTRSASGVGAVISDGTGAGQLFLVEEAGVRQLTDGAIPEMFPMVSADGQRVVYSRKVGQTEDLFVYDLAADQERPLVGGAGDQTRPRWVGERLLFFDEGRGPGRWDLVLREPDGELRVLGRDVRLPVRARPSVSPDGRWAAYATEGEEVVIVSLDGADRVVIATEHQRISDPALAQRGGQTWLAWTGLRSGDAGWRQLALTEISAKLPAR